MLFQTKYFGEIDCGEEERLSFPDGLFGFEDEKEFLLLPFEGSGGSLLCIQSAQTPGLAFVAVNPFHFKPDYAPALTDEELQALGVQRSEELCFYVLCAVKEPVGESTLNLCCPVAVNDQSQEAMQVILETGVYHMHHKLGELSLGGEAPLC